MRGTFRWVTLTCASCLASLSAAYPAVLVAAYLVVTMPLGLLRWLVIVVVLYAAAVMLRAAIKGRREHSAEPATAEILA